MVHVCKMLALGAFFHFDLEIGAVRGDRFSACLCAGIHLDVQILLEAGIPFSHES